MERAPSRSPGPPEGRGMGSSAPLRPPHPSRLASRLRRMTDLLRHIGLAVTGKPPPGSLRGCTGRDFAKGTGEKEKRKSPPRRASGSGRMGIGEALSPHRIIAPRASRVKGNGIRGLPAGPGAPPLPGNPGPLLDAARERGRGAGRIGRGLETSTENGWRRLPQEVGKRRRKTSTEKRRRTAGGYWRQVRGARHEGHARGAGAAANSSPGHKGGR